MNKYFFILMKSNRHFFSHCYEVRCKIYYVLTRKIFGYNVKMRIFNYKFLMTWEKICNRFPYCYKFNKKTTKNSRTKNFNVWFYQSK